MRVVVQLRCTVTCIIYLFPVCVRASGGGGPLAFAPPRTHKCSIPRRATRACFACVRLRDNMCACRSWALLRGCVYAGENDTQVLPHSLSRLTFFNGWDDG